MNWFSFFGICSIITGYILVNLMWLNATPFWRCEGVYNGYLWAIKQCFQMSLGMSIFILGVFSVLGIILIYIGGKENKDKLETKSDIK